MRSTRTLSTPIGLRLTEATILLAVAVLLPMVVHQIPAVGAAPWGARLLAMFVAPFVGLLLFRLPVALVPAVLAPFLNNLLFDRPIDSLVPLITVELVVFTLAAYFLLSRNRRLWIAAPLAYLATKGVSGGLIAFSGLFDAFAPATAFVIGSIVVGLPGLAIMVALHVLLVNGQWREKG